MMATQIGEFAGAVLAVFLLSRLLRWALRHRPEPARTYLALGATLMLAVPLAAVGAADGESLRLAYAARTYGPAVLFWLLVDIVRARRHTAQVDTRAPIKASIKQKAPLLGWAAALAGGITLLASSYRPAREIPLIFGEGSTFQGAQLHLPGLFVGVFVTVVAAVQLLQVIRERHAADRPEEHPWVPGSTKEREPTPNGREE